MNNKNLALGITLGILVPVGVLASNLTLPFTFTAGTPIRASEVNANFAAIQTAVNSKLDSSEPRARNGSRLQLLALRSADGMSVPLTVMEPFSVPFFDSTLHTYCYPAIATDAVVRCLPSGLNNLPTGAPGYYFTDAACQTTPLYYSEVAKPYGADRVPGMPVATGSYTRVVGTQPDGGAAIEVRLPVRYTGPLYTVGTGGNCLPTTTSTPLYQPGSTVVPASSFEPILGGVLN